MIEDIENFEKINQNQNQNPIDCSSTEIITSDSSLRNLFHLGYNSKSLTKSIVNSIKFDDAVTSIIQFAQKNELSIKSCGPLILGLVRIYDKKIKLYIEELLSLFQLKTSARTNPIADEQKLEQEKKKTRSKRKIPQGMMSSMLPENITQDTSFLMKGNVLSLSPLNEGLFSMFNNNETNKTKATTPLKFNSGFKNSSLESSQMEILRAALPDGTSASRNIIESVSKVNNNQMLKENEDVNNFFDYISDNKNDNLNENLQLDLDVNLNVNDQKNESIAKQLDFTSASKSLLGSVNLKEIPHFKKHARRKIIPRNAKLEYDEETAFRLNPEDIHAIDVKATMKNYKEYLRSKDTILLDKLLQEDANSNFLSHFSNLNVEESKVKEENENENDNHYSHYDLQISQDIMKNLSNLNLDMKDFSNALDFNEKLNKIIEEEKEKLNEKKYEEEGADKLSALNADIDQGMDDVNNNQIQEEDLKIQIKSLKNELNSLFSKDMKKSQSYTFSKLLKKSKTKFMPYNLFYDLLCLAQDGEVDLEQGELFSNDSILIAPGNR